MADAAIAARRARPVVDADEFRAGARRQVDDADAAAATRDWVAWRAFATLDLQAEDALVELDRTLDVFHLDRDVVQRTHGDGRGCPLSDEPRWRRQGCQGRDQFSTRHSTAFIPAQESLDHLTHVLPLVMTEW